MKIGYLLRRLHVATSVGWPVNVSPNSIRVIYPIDIPPGSGEDATAIPSLSPWEALCESACVYIWLGGEIRYGHGYLAVHRGTFRFPSAPPYPDQKAEQEEREAVRAEWEIEHRYVTQMGAPESLWDKITTSGSMVILNSSYVDSELLRRSPSVSAGLGARCGTPAPTSRDFLFKKVTMNEVAAATRCEIAFFDRARASAWASIFRSPND
jgi:hypothetical protein